MMTDRDHDDLDLADAMMAQGKALRARVLKRVRQRKWRNGSKEKAL